jgi:hypothetical protein
VQRVSEGILLNYPRRYIESLIPPPMTTTLSFEIIDINGKALICQADADNAVTAILALLGLTGDELMLDTEDWRDYDWFDGRNVYTSTEIIENDLMYTSTDVCFTDYRDITSLVKNGDWCVINNRAYCLTSLPRVRKRLRRGDFAKARTTMAIIKLRQLVELSNELSLKKRGEHHATID